MNPHSPCRPVDFKLDFQGFRWLRSLRFEAVFFSERCSGIASVHRGVSVIALRLDEVFILHYSTSFYLVVFRMWLAKMVSTRAAADRTSRSARSCLRNGSERPIRFPCSTALRAAQSGFDDSNHVDEPPGSSTGSVARGAKKEKCRSDHHGTEQLFVFPQHLSLECRPVYRRSPAEAALGVSSKQSGARLSLAIAAVRHDRRSCAGHRVVGSAVRGRRIFPPLDSCVARRAATLRAENPSLGFKLVGESREAHAPHCKPPHRSPKGEIETSGMR